MLQFLGGLLGGAGGAAGAAGGAKGLTSLEKILSEIGHQKAAGGMGGMGGGGYSQAGLNQYQQAPDMSQYASGMTNIQGLLGAPRQRQHQQWQPMQGPAMDPYIRSLLGG
jgi:hypothetical protein